MTYNESLADRVRNCLNRQNVEFVEKQMMGGLCLMVDDKMCLGVSQHRLMVRLDPAIYEEALTKQGCAPMEFTGRPLKSFVFVHPEGYDLQTQLEYWISLALEFNPRAKSSKKKSSSKTAPTKPAKSAVDKPVKGANDLQSRRTNLKKSSTSKNAATKQSSPNRKVSKSSRNQHSQSGSAQNTRSRKKRVD